MLNSETEERMQMSGVYQIKNLENGKCYIGSTKCFKDRLYRHIKNLQKNTHHSNKLQNAFNKYGENSFEFIILEIVQKDENILLIEQKWVDKFNSAHNGYNVLHLIRPNPVLVGYDNARSKEVICVNTGKIYPSIRQAELRTGLREGGVSACCRHEIEAIHNQVWLFTSEWNTLTDEDKQYYYTKAKTYKENSRQYNQHYKQWHVRPIKCIELDRIFNSAYDCAQFINQINGGHILECCRGKRKTCGGYHWEYADK